MATYKVNAKFLKVNPDAVTLVDGILVAFNGKESVHESKGSVNHPPVKKKIAGINQAQMKHLFEVERHPAIEIAEKDPAAGKE